MMGVANAGTCTKIIYILYIFLFSKLCVCVCFLFFFRGWGVGGVHIERESTFEVGFSSLSLRITI